MADEGYRVAAAPFKAQPPGGSFWDFFSADSYAPRARMTYEPPPKTGFVETLIRVPWVGETRWRNRRGDRLYTWDGYHREFEVFTRRGKHLGAVDLDGRFVKSAVEGRSIDV